MADYKKELEEFTYIVSHDLNAPLRHIKAFGNLLVKKLGDKVTDDEREYLSHLETSIEKAETLLDAILDYSRISTRSEKPKEFDVNDLVVYVTEVYRKPIDKKNAIINISDLPQKVTAAYNQILNVFWYLIDNALKYHNSDSAPVIDISAVEKDGYYVFSVTDNGIGIPEKNREDVFKMFRRLEPNYAPESVGTGLTLARKIIDDHGGEIWIDETPDHKTSICFTLPV